MKKSFQNRAQPQQRPESPLALANRRLGEIEKNARFGQKTKAIAQCQTMLKQYPDYFGVLHKLGKLYYDSGDFNKSAAVLSQAAALDPSNVIVRLLLAKAHTELGNTEAAGAEIRAALEMSPEAIEALGEYGSHLNGINEFERAKAVFEEIISRAPKSSAGWTGLGLAFSEMGQNEQANEVWHKAITLKPLLMNPIRALSFAPADKVNVDLEQALEQFQEASSDNSVTAKIGHGFTKANILLQRGNLGEGITELKKANALKFAEVQSEHKTLTETRPKFRAALDKLPVVTKPAPTSAEMPVSIHIFGPSRSGKSTLERLIGTLPEVQCGFESRILLDSTRKTFMRSGLPTHKYSYQLPTATDATYLKFYRDSLLKYTAGKAFFTSTTPGRIYDLYHLARVIPNLRLVFVQRNVDDVAYHMFRRLYSNAQFHSYDIDAARDYVNWYYSMQNRFAALLPNLVKTVTYEDMVTDPLRIANEVREFCGIPTGFGKLPDIGDDRGAYEPVAQYF